jgi:hypothetical protein
MKFATGICCYSLKPQSQIWSLHQFREYLRQGRYVINHLNTLGALRSAGNVAKPGDRIGHGLRLQHKPTIRQPIWRKRVEPRLKVCGWLSAPYQSRALGLSNGRQVFGCLSN